VIAYAYSKIIEHFPYGGGGYVVASKLLGDHAGLISGLRAARRLHLDGVGVDRLGRRRHLLALVHAGLGAPTTSCSPKWWW